MASANPEDYTNRGRIITPLKDRFGSQIRTHYPLEVATELAIVRQEARSPSVGGVDVRMPDYLAEVITTLSHLARASTHVNQRSGVSVRLSVTNYEVVVGQRPAPGAAQPASASSCRASTTSRRWPPARAARSRSSRSTRVARAPSSRTS